MAAWSLYRHDNGDGSSKDWAVRSNPDGSISTRWGKTAPRLPSISTRKQVTQSDIEREKRGKGYVFIAMVDIDSDGTIAFPGQAPPSKPPAVIAAVYWHIDAPGIPSQRIELADWIRTFIDHIQSSNGIEPAPDKPWNGWQKLIDLTETGESFSLSGQIKQAQGVRPLLFLLALKKLGLEGLDIGIASENSREVSVDLKAEAELLAFFETDIDRIRPLAEALGLLRPRLNLAVAIPDAEDRWF